MGKPDTPGTRSKALFEVLPLHLALLFRSRDILQEHNHLATLSTPQTCLMNQSSIYAREC